MAREYKNALKKTQPSQGDNLCEMVMAKNKDDSDLRKIFKHTPYYLTFRGFTGKSSSISESFKRSCIKEPLQDPAAMITAFLLYSVFLEV